MKTISKLSDECKKCAHVNDCNNKRMVMCAAKELPKQAAARLTTPLTTTLSAPMLRPHTPITINMGAYGKIDTSLEEITEKMKEDFYKNLNCSFKR